MNKDTVIGTVSWRPDCIEYYPKSLLS